MTELWIGAAALMLLAALFLLLPGLFLRQRHISDQTESNRDWFAQRSTELGLESGSAEEEQALLHDAQLRMLDEAKNSGAPVAGSDAAGGGRPGLILMLPLILLSVLGYWQLGAAGDVQLKRTLQGFSQDSSEEEYRALMLQVEERALQRPDNLHYQAMLGRFYMNETDYGRARDLYVRLAEQAPGDASALALAAQASYLAAGRELDQDSQMLAERALSVDPHQRTALGLLGMSSYDKGQYQAAISYWQRLLVMEDPASQSAQMIQSVIARAQQSLGGEVVSAMPSDARSGGATVAAFNGAGVTLQLALPESAVVAPTDTVFVFARDAASGSRMPIAVQRLSVAQLPLTVRLDDRNSMAGQKISELAEVTVIARVSPAGQRSEEGASYSARLDGVVPDESNQPLQLVFEPAGNN